MNRRGFLALLALLTPMAGDTVRANTESPTAIVEGLEGDEILTLSPFGTKNIAILDGKNGVIIVGDLEGLRILVTDEMGNLVFPKWSYKVDAGKVVITFSEPGAGYWEGPIYLSFIDFRGRTRTVALTWV